MKAKSFIRNVIAVCMVIACLIWLAGDARGQRSAGAIVAVDEAVGIASSGARSGGGSAQSGSAGGSGHVSSAKQGGQAASSKKKTTKVNPPTQQAAATASYKGPVIGDKYTFLNFEVISAAKPTHTIVAKKAGAAGLVQVEVLISENGNVLTAHARTGNKLLWDEAERAALASKFNKPSVNGQPARALGFLVYRFGPPSDEDDDD